MDVDGSVVAFESLADNIVANTPGNSFQQVYLRATCVALPVPSPVVPCRNTAEAASVDANGKLGTGDSVTPALGPGGSITVFATRATNLLPANTSSQQIFEANTCFGATGLPCVPSIGQVVSVDQNGLPGQGDSSNPAFRLRVVFTSQASLLAGVSGQQVYATDVCTFAGQLGCPSRMVLVSADSSGKPVGGDHAAMEIIGKFATFSSGTSAPAQVFLAAPFL